MKKDEVSTVITYVPISTHTVPVFCDLLNSVFYATRLMRSVRTTFHPQPLREKMLETKLLAKLDRQTDRQMEKALGKTHRKKQKAKQLSS